MAIANVNSANLDSAATTDLETTVTVLSRFKANKSKGITEENKREDLTWSFRAVTEIGLAILCEDKTEREKIATILTHALENYGRKLILDNSDNWEFSPEGLVTIDELYKELTKPVTRKKSVTKKKIVEFGEFYRKYAEKNLGKTSESATVGSQVICNLSQFAGNVSVLNAIESNILKLLETDLPEDELLECEKVIEYVCDKIVELKNIDTESLTNSL